MMPRMAYDEELANRIRELVGAGPGIDEKRMFGGLAFLVEATWRWRPAGRAG
jgi:hypothetical protein